MEGKEATPLPLHSYAKLSQDRRPGTRAQAVEKEDKTTHDLTLTENLAEVLAQSSPPFQKHLFHFPKESYVEYCYV